MAKKPKYYVRPDGLHEAIRVINGKRVPFRGRTDAEVEQKMIAYKEKEERGPLFEEVAERWKEEHFPTLAISTAHGYEAAYKRVVMRFEDMPMKDITPANIDALLQNMARQQYGKKTVANQRLVVNLICRAAVLDGVIRSNPCADVRTPKGLLVTPRELPSDEELEIVKNAWQEPGGLLPFFILFSGSRKGEALAITYDDIKHKQKIIKINKSITYKGQKPSVKLPKTFAGKRDVILLDKLAAVMPRGIGNALVFPGKNGGLMRASEYERAWKRWQNRVGVTVTAHQLRHGFATLLYEAGVSEREAMELMGHADITLTHKIYTHIRKSRKEETAAKLNETANKF